MKNYARIENDAVAELFQTAGKIADMFHPDLVWVDVTDVLGIEPGWVKSGLGFVPPPAIPLGKIKERVWEDIKAERDHRTENGGYKVGDHWYHSDAKSRSQQQDNEAIGSGLVPVEWKTMDGSFVTMTSELAAQIRAARMSSDREIFAVAEAHRVAMEAAADPAGYDFSGGWPKVYGEE